MAGEKSIEGDGERMGLAEFSATSSFDAHSALRKRNCRDFFNFFYGRSYCAPAVRADLYSIDVHSFSFEKERTKKANQRLPPLETASVPRYKAGWGERHLYPAASPAALPPRAAGGGRKSFFFLGRGWRLDSPFWRQAQKTKSFLLDILFDSGASQIAKTFAFLLTRILRVCKFL